MILLNKEQIKYLHSKMIQETGGSNGIRDEGLLDSALSAPFQSFGGMELYPSMIETIPNPQQSWGESCTQVAMNEVP